MAATLTMTKDGSKIAQTKITRPSFSTSTSTSIQVDDGEDRRHVVAWIDLRDEIDLHLSGKTLAQARDFLTEAGVSVADASLAAIQAGVWELARAKFNDVGNLWAGPSAQNRILGANIRKANRLSDMRGQLSYPFDLEIDIVTTDDDQTVRETATIPIQNPQQMLEWKMNVSLDWRNADDVQRGIAFYEALIRKYDVTPTDTTLTDDDSNMSVGNDGNDGDEGNDQDHSSGDDMSDDPFHLDHGEDGRK